MIYEYSKFYFMISSKVVTHCSGAVKYQNGTTRKKSLFLCLKTCNNYNSPRK